MTVCKAQQEAQRAQFYVEKAKQDQRQKIIQAEGEAEAARMVTICLTNTGSTHAATVQIESEITSLMNPHQLR